MNKWHVKPTYCTCHPETCCHWNWSLHSPDGERDSTHQTREKAQVLADLRNQEDDKISELESSVETLKRELETLKGERG